VFGEVGQQAPGLQPHGRGGLAPPAAGEVLDAWLVLPPTSRPNDGTAGGVVTELERSGVAVVRADVGDFPLDVTLVASMGGHRERLGSLGLAGKHVRLDEIRAIYYRRPTGFRFPDHLSSEHQRFA
jgi:hypothetical protein